MYYGPERKNQRLKDYDYSSAGYYFVTFCTKNRIDYFGEIVDGEMVLNDYGEIIHSGIISTENIRKEIELDEYIIMPNHIHIIIIIKNTEHKTSVGNAGMRSDNFDLNPGNLDVNPDNLDMNPKSGPHACDPYENDSYENRSYENEVMNKTKNHLSNCIQGFKAYITRNIRQNYGDYEFAWQKSFHDVVIRNQDQLDKTREYIILNPSKWEEDSNNINSTR